ncbi:MAG: DNA polymerase III subunit beta [Burkholderiales bacterium]|jgi:DNA polymerase-3 subunit beta|nr:DNA polymerase III subunit beta [Burkholderiales bacterium]
MLLEIQRDILLQPLILTTGFVDRKQTMPILSNIYMQKVADEITIISNDMEIQAKVTLSGEMAGDDFIITLPARKLQDILKIFPEQAQVVFEKQDNKIEIKSGLTKFVLQTLPADHYPLLKINDQQICQFTLLQKDLKARLTQICYAMADKDSRVFLNGMFFEIKNNQLHLVATDAHRLGLMITAINEQIDNCSAIIPKKTIIELLKFLDNGNEEITVKFFNSQVAFETKGKELITKVIDGKYPDYERVIPLNNEKLCLINREKLLRAIERVSAIGVDKLKIVTFEIEKNKLILTCNNEEQEGSQDQIDVVFKPNEALRVSFNINYVKDLLSNTQAENLQFAFLDGVKSVLVTIPDDSSFKAVLMPFR